MAQKITRIRRTPTQVVLYFVSVVMLLLAIVMTLLGALAVLIAIDPNLAGGLSPKDVQVGAIGGLLIIAAGMVTLVTGVLGVWAANDQSRIGAYRLLCYSVALLTLLVIVYGWSNGTFLLFNPLVLSVTIVYVLVCSSLADRIQDERDLGIKGTVIYRDGHQRALHFLVSIIVAEGILYLLIALASYLLVANDVVELSVHYVQNIPAEIARALGEPLVMSLSWVIAGAVNLLVGLLGLHGANHPTKIVPFLAISVVVTVLMATFYVFQAVSLGPLSPDALSSVISVLFSAACTVLSVKVRSNAGKILD